MSITNPNITLPSSSSSSSFSSSSKPGLALQAGQPSAPTLPSKHDFSGYKALPIKELTIGPAKVSFKGRIVNLIHRPWSAGNAAVSPDHDSKASGYFKLVVSDGTDVIVVKLFYAEKPMQELNLGTLIHVNASHISPQDPDTKLEKHAGLFISIFPERDPTVLLTIVYDTDEDNASMYRVPLGYRPGLRYTPGIKSLSEVLAGAEVKGDILRTLVVVKSISPVREVTFNKDEVSRTATTVEVLVRDTTAEVVLSLWDHCSAAPRHWAVGLTVLLLSKPILKAERRKRIMLGPATTVEIDPELSLAVELRFWSEAKIREEHVNLPFPTEALVAVMGDASMEHTAAQKIKFTLGNIDQFVRTGEHGLKPEIVAGALTYDAIETYLGYFALIILEMNLSKLQKRNMLCSGQCCGNALFSSKEKETCQSCDRAVQLRPNPSIIGRLSDETGSVCGDKLIWSDQGWRKLLGRDNSQLVAMSQQGIREIEAAVLYCHVTLLMCWIPEIGRLIVCDIHV